MRYFRFQGESKVAAVLFGLLEEANFPQSKRLRNRLNGLKYASEPEDWRLLEFVLDPLVPQQTLLSVWNFEYQFYIHLKRLFTEKFAQQSSSEEDFFRVLQEKLQFELVNYWEHHYSNLPSLTWSVAEDCTVLLYRYYSVESIAITPCGHLFPKSSLFASARQAMGIPRSQTEFEQTHFPCNCGQNISTAVFLLAKEAARPLDKAAAISIYHSLLTEEPTRDRLYRDIPSDRCGYCRQQKGRIICRRKHRLCITCLAGLTITRLQFRCIFCQDKVSGFSRDEVCSQIQTVTCNPNSEVAVMCEVCRIYVNFSDFGESWDNSHSCLICNTCKSGSKAICPSCEEGLMAVQPIKLADRREGQFYCDVCYGSGQIARFGAALLSRCGCLVCDRCVMKKWIEGNYNCPKCHAISAFNDMTNAEKQEKSLLILCRKCGYTNGIASFLHASLLSHWPKCRICDVCLTQQLSIHFLPTCQICLLRYDEADLKHLSKKRQALVEKTRELAPSRYCQQCNKCGERREAAQFAVYSELGHVCRVCDDCYDRKKADRAPLQCPLCQRHFNTEESGKICKFLSSSAGIQTTDAQMQCKKCFKQKSRQFLAKCSNLRHHCSVCDECIERPIHPELCPACGEPYSSTDLAVLGRSAPQKCKCGKIIPAEASTHCSSRCFCPICYVKDFLLTGKSHCSKCLQVVTGYRIRSLACSNCFRDLREYSSDFKQTVCGICTNEHVFCCFCTGLSNCLTACRLCGAAIDVKTPVEVAAAQQKFQLACFCGQSAEHREKSRLSCGHEAHSSCYENLYLCRLCGQQFKTFPARKVLRSYLE